MDKCSDCLFCINSSYCLKQERFTYNLTVCKDFATRAESMWLCELMCNSVEEDDDERE